MSPRTFISSGSRWEALAGYSRAVVDGRWVFVSGTVGYDARAGTWPKGAAAQATVAFGVIERALHEAGAAMLDVVRVRVYVPDRRDVAAVSGVVKDRLGAARAANTTVCAPLAVAQARVEIEVTALKPASRPPLGRRASSAATSTTRRSSSRRALDLGVDASPARRPPARRAKRRARAAPTREMSGYRRDHSRTLTREAGRGLPQSARPTRHSAPDADAEVVTRHNQLHYVTYEAVGRTALRLEPNSPLF
jgi:enamine deaminase RidA (YjgF/YER057c/UK114 family)